jgi:hypothetical protein
MAVVEGTNAGFVLAAPTVDPAGTVAQTIDGNADASKHTAPVGATAITEIGWWCDTASEDTNFEVGLYDSDGAGGIPGTRLAVAATNTKGTGAGWKSAAVACAIIAEHVYWIAVQVDNVVTATSGNAAADTTGAYSSCYGEATLGASWMTVDASGTKMRAYYAVYTSGGATVVPPVGRSILMAGIPFAAGVERGRW